MRDLSCRLLSRVAQKIANRLREFPSCVGGDAATEKKSGLTALYTRLEWL